MVRPLSTSLHDQSATVRQLKLLIIVLVLSNVGLGVFSFYLLRNLDHRYSEMIDHSVPLLSDLQTLTARSITAMRGTNLATFNAPGANRADLVQRGRNELAAERAFREKILRSSWFATETAQQEILRAAGEAFSRAGNEVLTRIGTDRLDEAGRVRETEVRAAFDRYLTAITNVADEIEARSLRANESISAKTGSMSNVVLGIASWPFVLLGSLLLLTAIFVVVLMVLFRGREMNDMP